MRGYPKTIATKRDFNNLLTMPEYKKQALADLKRLQAVDDAKVVRVVSGSEEDKNLITEEIDNPMPKWKQAGFAVRKDLDNLITAKEVAINGK